jgi:outer membrane protein assembly factor BamB
MLFPLYGNDFRYFDTKDLGPTPQDAALIQPWKVIKLDPEYGGQWVVAGDIDADGEVELISAENINQSDVHYTSTAVAQNLDGSVLWRWGDPKIGRKNWHHDVACQIHDWNGDGKKEIILLTKGFLVELNGTTGKELRRLPIPPEATDCLVFCNLSGGKQPTDVLIKNRYHQIWAYNQNGTLLWTVKNPGGYRTAHQPRPLDLDGDGHDEIWAGYAMLNSDGSVRWVYKSKKVDQKRGHLDCGRLVRRGRTPADFRLALTCCGANNVALIDGNGKMIWEIAGRHFESIDVGRIIPNHAGFHICIDIDHQPYGNSPIWIFDEKGNQLGQIVTPYSRHHALLDWTGDDAQEILVAHNNAIYNHLGRRLTTFHTPGLTPPGENNRYEKSMLIGDMTGDGIPDATLATPDHVFIFKNTKGQKPKTPVPLGTEFNFTLY